MVEISYGPVHMDPKKNSTWRVNEMRRVRGRIVMVIGHTFANTEDAEAFLEGRS